MVMSLLLSQAKIPAKKKKQLMVVLLVTAAFTLPVFRSGGRTGLSFFGWIVNHTIWGPPVEYVPEEDYTKELSLNERRL